MHTRPENPSLSTELFAEEPLEPSRGTLIDRFLVLEQLGAGGMGVVYAAHDPELDRKVALKLLLPRAGSAGYGDQARLMREAQALAKLAHPNVVAVHDVGTRGSRVWIAMEFVAGQTLTAWAKERPRRWTELLAVLADVARGMAAAHEAGLVHRDIKPDNVMIGQDSRVRVMDFGLAHGRATAATEPDLTSTLESGHLTAPLALRLTAQGAVQGTPAYMAPEQWLGHDEEPATDQFGWSVMAWELLYGERPFAGASNLAIATAVLAGQRRPPPCGRSVPSWLRRVLERGLATEPAKRWPNMAALLSALDRGKTRARVRLAATALAGIAVIAASTEAYRRWDLAQRVATCAAAGAVIDQTWNDDARQRLRDAFQATGVSYAATSAEKTIPWLDKQATEWKRARTGICLNATVRGIWNHDLWDRAMWCIEDRQMEFESLVDELHHADATTVQKAVSAAAGPRVTVECLVDSALQRLPAPPVQGGDEIRKVRVVLSQATSLSLSGHYNDALALAKQARERAKALHWSPLLAAARAREGILLARTGAFTEAEAASTDAYFTAASSGAWSIAQKAAVDIITSTCEMADYAHAQMWAKHAEIAVALSGDWAHLREAARLGALSRVYTETGDYEEAKTLVERAMALDEQSLGPEHPDIAFSLNLLANIHTEMGDIKKAQSLHSRALSLRERVLGPEHPDVATTLSNLGVIHLMLGDFTESLALHSRALIIEREALGFSHPTVAATLGNIANVFGAMGDDTQFRTYSEHALVILQQVYGPNHPSVANALMGLAIYFKRTGQHEKSRELLQQSIAIFKKTMGPTHPSVALCLSNLANLHRTMGRHEDARSTYEQSLTIYEANSGTQPGEAATHYTFALALAEFDPPRALVEARKARDVLRAGGGSETMLAEIEQWLANLSANTTAIRKMSDKRKSQ